MDPSHVVASVNELADQGLVERAPDPEDRRRNTITITEDGTRHLRVLDRKLRQAQDLLLAPLTLDERAGLTALLGRLLDHHGAASP
jgi:DNA-binding MarR family transcriptional regulator